MQRTCYSNAPPPSDQRRTLSPKREREQADGEAGHLANYKNLDDLPTTESVAKRSDGGPFLLHESGPGGDRVLLLRTQGDIRLLTNADAWGPSGRSRFALPSGPSCKLPARWLAGIASRSYTPSS